MTSPQHVTTDEALEILASGDLEVLGRMPWASNQTFLAKITGGDAEPLVVYKPKRGERPLWDFPRGTLCSREVACFLVSEALQWVIVPPTVLRDGPLGDGMAQLFIDHDPDRHYLNLCDDHAARFRQFAAFDVVVNNADRKSGHCIQASDGHIWGIDHGVTFHAAQKLRTVIWDFAGEPVPIEVQRDLEMLGRMLRGELGSRLSSLLSDGEVEMTASRIERLVVAGVFPQPRTDYPYPWPVV